MSVCPKREKMIGYFGLTEETFAAQTTLFLAKVKPFFDDLLAFMESQGANFPDKV